MTTDELARRVDDVIARSDDPESAHSAEDELMEDWIHDHADPEALELFRKMWRTDFPRWCA